MPETQAKTGNTIDQRQEWLIEHDAEHQLNRDLREGVPAMQQAAREFRYMKPNPGELSPMEGQPGVFDLGRITVNGRVWSRYDLRIERSDLPNPWADSIDDTARLPFRARIVLDGWDPELQGSESGEPVGWVADMDGEGRSLDELASDSFRDALYEGAVYWFVDNDPRIFGNRAQRKAAKARPYVTKLKTCDLRQLHYKMENGRPRLVYLAFDQPQVGVDFSDPNNWTEEERHAIKVVRAGSLAEGGDARVSWELFVQDDDGTYSRQESGFITADNSAAPLTEIPLVFLPSERTGPYRAKSPYLKTAPTQQAIWIFNSEVSGLAREVIQSRWYETGEGMLEPGVTGGKELNQDTNNARYKFSSAKGAGLNLVESTGQPLTSIRELIADKVDQIKQAHHDIETQEAVTTTATEIRLQGMHANSSLEQWLILQEAGWKKALDFMALLDGQSQRGTVEIPHDFGLPSQGMERNHALYMAGKMTGENYWHEAQRAGDVDEKEFDLKAELAREKEEKVSSDRARERLEKDMDDALRTPDNDDEPEDGKKEADA